MHRSVLSRVFWTSLGLSTMCLALSLRADEPAPTRPLKDLDKDYFPFTPVADAASWTARRAEIQQRILVAAGLYPVPDRTPLHAAVYGRIEREDYTVERVTFESVPGHFVTGNLYLPRHINGKIPAILSPHGHWPNGRFMIETDKEVKKQIASGAEQFENGARSPLQARCVQLARMGCAVFFYDMLGYADSVQFPEHRHGPAARGFMSADAELNLVSYFGLQTWNSVRAVDFIASLPYVDTTRIGCTGASGGGTQTMILSAIDSRIAAAFPCVMVSTAMQGGCTCENGQYLRVNQGNIDIAAVTAPRPLGMTAADDWTKELQTKGFPDLKNLYTLLGVPDRVEAHFNLQFPHNYNAVSRGQMYAFFNRYFHLGLSSTAERDFALSTPKELSVWDDQHPRPSGSQVGEAHEVALVDWFKQQSAHQVGLLLHPKTRTDFGKTREVLGRALEVMIGRELPGRDSSTIAVHSESDVAGCQVVQSTVTCGADNVETVWLYPKKWNHSVVVWLTMKGSASVTTGTGGLSEPAQKLIDRGYAIACPQLYLLGASRNPNVYAIAKRKVIDTYEGFSGYHYGYNPTLFAERVRDALSVIAAARDDRAHRAHHVLLAGVEGAGPIAAAAAALAKGSLEQLVCDTQGFRFAKLENVWDVNFVPGAEKYGDLPAMLALCAPTRTTVVGETIVSAEGVVSSFRVAGGRVRFAGAGQGGSADSVVRILVGTD